MSVLKCLGALRHAAISPKAARAHLSEHYKPDLERLDPTVFLANLETTVGMDDYRVLVDRVIFDGEELSDAILVRRLIARVFHQLTFLNDYSQTAEWRETVAPFIEQESLPETMSVDEFVIRSAWCSVPFVQLPRPDYAQHPAAAGGSVSLFLIMSMHHFVTARVHAIPA